MGRGKHIYRAEKDGVNLYEGTMQEITKHFMCSDNVVYRSVSGGRLYKGIRFVQTEQCLYQCLEHNGYPVDDYNREYWKKRIGLTKFERWLTSEGYIRGL